MKKSIFLCLSSALLISPGATLKVKTKEGEVEAADDFNILNVNQHPSVPQEFGSASALEKDDKEEEIEHRLKEKEAENEKLKEMLKLKLEQEEAQNKILIAKKQQEARSEQAQIEQKKAEKAKIEQKKKLEQAKIEQKKKAELKRNQEAQLAKLKQKKAQEEKEQKQRKIQEQTQKKIQAQKEAEQKKVRAQKQAQQYAQEQARLAEQKKKAEAEVVAIKVSKKKTDAQFEAVENAEKKRVQAKKAEATAAHEAQVRHDVEEEMSYEQVILKTNKTSTLQQKLNDAQKPALVKERHEEFLEAYAADQNLVETQENAEEQGQSEEGEQEEAASDSDSNMQNIMQSLLEASNMIEKEQVKLQIKQDNQEDTTALEQQINLEQSAVDQLQTKLVEVQQALTDHKKLLTAVKSSQKTESAAQKKVEKVEEKKSVVQTEVKKEKMVVETEKKPAQEAAVALDQKAIIQRAIENAKKYKKEQAMIQVAGKKDQSNIQIVETKSTKKEKAAAKMAESTAELKAEKKSETKEAAKVAKAKTVSLSLKKAAPTKKAEKKMVQEPKELKEKPIPTIKVEEDADEDFPPPGANKTEEAEKVDEGVDTGEPIEEPKELQDKEKIADADKVADDESPEAAEEKAQQLREQKQVQAKKDEANRPAPKKDPYKLSEVESETEAPASPADPFSDPDFSSSELKDAMNSYNAEEKEALSTPLKASEMEKMVKGSTALMKELTKDLDSMETRKMKTFWKDKPFFRKHNGLDKSA